MTEVIPFSGSCTGGTRVAVIGQNFVDNPALRSASSCPALYLYLFVHLHLYSYMHVHLHWDFTELVQDPLRYS